MQYWINHDGVQAGPVTRNELKDMALTSRAYVWHEGLSDWVKITQLPELEGLYKHIEVETEGYNQTPAEAIEGKPLTQDGDQEAHVEVPPIPEAVVGQPYQPAAWQKAYPQAQPQQQQPYQPQYQAQQAANEPCPPTNLIWAIVTTLLCCLPTGVIAIIYAIRVSRLYQMGDVEGAKCASETGAWWCIASIILGIISQPLVMLIMMGGEAM